ncbi:MAG: MBL fold metallo-hydrolase [Nanoarchaeota archaeon]|nr:MBL fold metallo-hydrolase [Nanoarchaeota archaeon]
MEPKIIFLGTAGDSLVYGNQIRSSGGIVLQMDGMQFIIDPGPGCLTRCADYGINIRNTVAVFVTHNHINHANDVNAVISAMTYNGLDKKGVLISNKTSFNGDENMRPMINEYTKRLVEKTMVLEKGQKIGIGDVEIVALDAKHNDKNTIGLRFFGSQFNLVYSSDTKYFRELGEDYKNCDIMIANTVYPRNSKGNTLSSDDVIKLMNKVNPKLTILTHFGIKMLKADPLYEAREIQKETGMQIISAKDGMTVNPLSYSTSSRQKTLNMFK